MKPYSTATPSCWCTRQADTDPHWLTHIQTQAQCCLMRGFLLRRIDGGRVELLVAKSGEVQVGCWQQLGFSNAEGWYHSTTSSLTSPQLHGQQQRVGVCVRVRVCSPAASLTLVSAAEELRLLWCLLPRDEPVNWGLVWGVVHRVRATDCYRRTQTRSLTDSYVIV